MNIHELITKKQMKHMIRISSWTPPLTIYKKTAWFQIGVTSNKIEIEPDKKETPGANFDWE